MGNVLEAQLDRGRGPVATVLVRNGTLHVGDYFICGAVFGKVRAMFDDRGQQIREAGPSTPVEVLGLESMPDVGDISRWSPIPPRPSRSSCIARPRFAMRPWPRPAASPSKSCTGRWREGEVKELPIIIKTDVGGTAEVLSDMMQKLSNEKVTIKVHSCRRRRDQRKRRRTGVGFQCHHRRFQCAPGAQCRHHRRAGKS